MKGNFFRRGERFSVLDMSVEGVGRSIEAWADVELAERHDTRRRLIGIDGYRPLNTSYVRRVMVGWGLERPGVVGVGRHLVINHTDSA